MRRNTGVAVETVGLPLTCVEFTGKICLAGKAVVVLESGRVDCVEITVGGAGLLLRRPLIMPANEATVAFAPPLASLKNSSMGLSELGVRTTAL